MSAALLLTAGIGLASCGDSSSDVTLVIGMEANYSPFNWTEYSADNQYNYSIQGQTGQYAAGYDVDVARYIADYNDWNLEIQKMEWDNLIPSVNNGQINAILAGMTDTAEREESIDFSDIYYQSELVLITRKDDPDFADTDDFDLSDLAGLRLIAQTGTVEDDIIADWVDDYGVTHLPATSDYQTAITDLTQDVADAVPAEDSVARAIVLADPDDYQMVHFDQTVLSDDVREGFTVSIGLQKGDPDVIEDGINAALAALPDSVRSEWMQDAIERSATQSGD